MTNSRSALNILYYIIYNIIFSSVALFSLLNALTYSLPIVSFEIPEVSAWLTEQCPLSYRLFHPGPGCTSPWYLCRDSPPAQLFHRVLKEVHQDRSRGFISVWFQQ